MKNEKNKITRITKTNRDYIDFDQMDLVNLAVVKQRRKRTINYEKKILNDDFLFTV